MAYIKNNWVDREGTTRYFETVDDDGALIFTPDYTQVTELGTPVNADNMNHIEEGIAAGSFTKFDLNTTYAKDDLVTVIEDSSPVIYKSLVDNNIGNALSSSIAWEKILNAGRIEEKIASLIPDNSSLIASYAMPSNKYIDLTLGASGSTYTAPANGWVNFRKLTTARTQFISLITNADVGTGASLGMGYTTWVSDSGVGNALEVTVPVKKGEKVEVGYNAGGSTLKFRFWYAVGSESEV